MTQQKIAKEPEEYQTPLERLLSFLRVPHKTYRDIYLAIVERYLSGKPYVIGFNETPYPAIAHRCNIEPALAKEKVTNLETMKWIRIISVDNANRVLEPVWRTKKGINQLRFAEALHSYRADIRKDEAEQTSTEEIYELMNSVCLHTHKAKDIELCSMHRWKECEECPHRKEK
jgi:hypothetical protein